MKPSLPTSACSAPLTKTLGKSRPGRCPSYDRTDSAGRRKAHVSGAFLLSGAAQESNLPSDGLRRLTGFEGLLRKVQLSTEAGFDPASAPLGAVRSAETGTNSGTKFCTPAGATRSTF